MKNYIEQIFNEGLGASVFVPIEKKLKSPLAKKIFRAIYFVIAVAIAGVLLYIRWPKY